MKFVLKLFLFISLLAGGTKMYAQAQDSIPLYDYTKAGEYEIGDVRVVGARFLDSKILVTLSGLAKGDKIKIPGEQIPKAMKALWRQKLFTNVYIVADKIEQGKIYLTIYVEERPRISRYTFRGVKNSDADDLKKKLELHAGSILTENMRSLTIKTVKDYYIDKGFLSVNVKLEEVKDTLLPNSVLVRIIVDKGVKVKIDQINIYGNHVISEAKIRNQMSDTHQRVKFDLNGLMRFKKNFSKDSTFRWYHLLGGVSPTGIMNYSAPYVNLNIFRSSKFKREDYESDKEKIIDYYNTKGYRDARIVWDTTYLINPKSMRIDIKVDEGKQYFFRNIFFNGNTKYPDSVLAKVVGIKRGEVYNQKLLEERVFQSQNGSDLSSLYMDDGYLFFSVTPLEVKVEGDSIDIELRISEGSQATINKVTIIGNTKTNEKVIRRELRTLPGNKFSRTDLLRSQREIISLGYFDPQQLDVVPIPNPENGTVDIEYKVTEKPADQLELSAGYGGTATATNTGGIFGTVGVNFTNFSLKNIFDKNAWTPLPSGDGQRFGVRFQSNGRAFQSYSVSFTEPWLGGKKPQALNFAFNRLRANSLNPLDYSQITGHYYSTSVYVGLGSRLKWPDDFMTGEIGLEFQYYVLNNYTSYFTYTTGDAINLNLQLTLSRDSRDIAGPTYYNKGFYVMFQGKYTLPYSYIFKGREDINYDDPAVPDATKYKWVEFHKWKTLFEWYTPIWKNLVFKTSADLSWLGYYNPRIGYSPFERVEFGGDGLSNLNEATQLGRDIISMRGYPIVTPTGGSPIFNKYSIELRYPFSLAQSATIYMLIFADAGNFWNDIQDYKPYELARAYGAGIRVFLPMFGLLGFDYGLGPDRTMFGLTPTGNNIFAKYGQFRIVLGREPE